MFTVSDNGVTVALDTVITPELESEGYVRELISKIQTMRKEAGFDVTDHINVTIDAGGKIPAALDAFGAELKKVVLAESVTLGEAKGYTKEWDINGEKANIGVEKL